MNNDELMTAVRDSFAGVDSATPVEQIVSRSRAIRARRRVPGIVGGLAVVAGGAIAATMLLPGHQPGGTPTVHLAAWTVVKQANGNITVTLRELRDPAGLQTKLRADGVPASVTFGGHQNPACRPYPASNAQLDMVFLRPPASTQPNRKLPFGHRPPPAPLRDAVTVVIHPSALPSGTGVQLAATAPSGPPSQGAIFDERDLVYASPQCTGGS